LLALLTLIVLLATIPDITLLRTYAAQMVVYALLTAFALFFSVWLSESELSPAHAVGIVALLSLPHNTYPLATWAIFAGGVAGGITLNIHNRLTRLPVLRRLRYFAFVTARVTLSFFAASQVYIALQGPLPLTMTSWEVYPAALLYCLVYITVYFAIFVLEIYVNRRPVGQIINTNIALILVIMLLPVPFALLSAEISNRLSTPSEIISLLGLMLIVLGLYALSRSEYQLRKQLNEMRTLSIVTRAMRAHLQLDALLRTIYLQVAHLLDIESFVVALKTPGEDRLGFPLVVRHGKEIEGDPADLARSYNNDLIKHVLETGLPLLIRQDVATAARNMRITPPDELSYSWLGVPLQAGGRIMGAIVATSNRPNHHFGTDDLRLLNIVAASASIAIENAQLYRQQMERAEQLSTLNKIAALLSGTLSPDTVLDIIISSASTMAEANSVAIFLFLNDGQKGMRLVRSAGLSDSFVANLPAPMLSQREKPLHRQMPLAVGDVTRDESATNLRDLMAQEGKSAFVELPLVVGNRGLGVLVLYYDSTQEFAGEQLDLLRTFSTQAAQAIINARTFATTDEAFQRSVEQLLTLASIGHMLTSTVDLTTICDLVLTHAVEATNSTAGVVGLYDEGRAALRVMAQVGYPDNAFQDGTAIEGGISRRALATGETQFVEDVEQAADYVRLIVATRSQLSVPIIGGKEDTLGFVTLESDRASGYSAEDSNFVAQIANQAVIAIDNARLFKRITEARDRLQVILDTMDEAIILIDSDGKIALANPRISLLGMNPEDLLDRKLGDLLTEPLMPDFPQRLGFETLRQARNFTQMLSSPGEWTEPPPHVYVVQDERGTLYVQRYIIPVPDEHGQIMGRLLVYYNKTEERELERTREELSRMIVHDLRSPLMAVTTGLRLLQEYIPEESEFYNLVHTTTEASRRAVRKLLSRVDSLLDISKMESGRLGIETDIVELRPMVEGVCVELSPLARELEIKLVSEIDDDLPALNVDADKVERLLLNLVDNALKYSPSESRILIRAYLPAADGADKPDFVQVDVIDNGPGIPEDYKVSLFDSFVQVEGRQRVRRGVGLGLAFCKLVAEAHGGSIWIEDNPAGGSIFSVMLPHTGKHELPSKDEPAEQKNRVRPPGTS
jgi:K+-sensing histidine kinase KdpD/PAS domain-containing protein